jgi:hypothetical protein
MKFQQEAVGKLTVKPSDGDDTCNNRKTDTLTRRNLPAVDLSLLLHLMSGSSGSFPSNPYLLSTTYILLAIDSRCFSSYLAEVRLSAYKKS